MSEPQVDEFDEFDETFVALFQHATPEAAAKTAEKLGAEARLCVLRQEWYAPPEGLGDWVAAYGGAAEVQALYDGWGLSARQAASVVGRDDLSGGLGNGLVEALGDGRTRLAPAAVEQQWRATPAGHFRLPGAFTDTPLGSATGPRRSVRVSTCSPPAGRGRYVCSPPASTARCPSCSIPRSGKRTRPVSRTAPTPTTAPRPSCSASPPAPSSRPSWHVSASPCAHCSPGPPTTIAEAGRLDLLRYVVDHWHIRYPWRDRLDQRELFEEAVTLRSAEPLRTRLARLE
ncbi:hypothetical protein OG802_19035 [Streptomyces sp. NBC_00704]|uniref:hypothetical protein n=1 Tax=Streptomyces sp. NBC_00704 TaxID=2975809 RepID=UPI002E2F818E|nr:hypothetical protein [Streptomyces sp. NBC_00704]